MIIKQIFLGSLIATFLMVGLNILSSQLPWGVESVTRTETPNHEVDELVAQQSESMNLILTQQSMSFVSTRPITYYSMNRFFSINLFLGILSAIFLCLLLHLIREKKMSEKMLIVSLFGLFCISSIHLSYWNWWGFSTVYSFGVSISTLLNLLIITYILTKFIFKPTL